ncbi:MAG: hypothetical protein PUJ51_11540 [Clostridiales bacterium]|uniref:hypothetical protein n=1 Tax=Terrisporobacter sp. TaxID=1965305 RepID=UPI002A5090BA|nr:hypothetical protein [Terrisporobacter sp.]MCI5630048.1 hypothetical protein [Clostridium sp.]MDD7755117.1 hypothetical protein [Clostridiales bacterium]MCI6459701.1 hypothetical protein [Clostridium sp.]MCI7207534.1 hypothetical protein [Clostridium sp.]MDY4137609.1 hypothetical protein [Terrisporobacter sp.]
MSNKKYDEMKIPKSIDDIIYKAIKKVQYESKYLLSNEEVIPKIVRDKKEIAIKIIREINTKENKF